MVLLQETGDPWSHFVATILLNQTTAAQARPVMRAVLQAYPTPADLASARLEDLAAILRPTGFHMVKAGRLISMSRVFAQGEFDPNNVRALPGIGPYGEESFRLIFKGEKFRPRDRKLQEWVDDRHHHR